MASCFAAQAGDARGAFQTSIPVETTPYHGLEPHLVLAYDSMRGNGPLGIGWAIQGLSSIVRLSESRGVPGYDEHDRFYLDGNELIPCPIDAASPYSRRAACQYPVPDGYPYTAKRETFERMARATGAADAAWTVWERSGTRRTYEAAADAASWHLARVEDVNGNIVDFRYGSASRTGLEVIDSISYNGTLLKFYWQDRTDVASFSNGAHIVAMKVRLASIAVSVSGHTARVYAIRYSLRPLTRISSIASIQVFGRDAAIDSDGNVTGSAYPAATYFYEGDLTPVQRSWTGSTVSTQVAGLAGTGEAELPIFSGTYLGTQTACSAHGRFRGFVSGDFDGDGRTDEIALKSCPWLGDKRVEIQFTQVQSRNAVSQSSLSFPIDADFSDAVPNDHRDWYFYAMPADTNGDGRQDLVILSWRPAAGSIDGPLELLMNVALSNGQGGFRWASPEFLPTGWITFATFFHPQLGPRCTAGDFSGTRRAELVCIFQDGSGEQKIGRAVARRDGSLQPLAANLLAPSPWPPSAIRAGIQTRQIVAGDVNHDGLTDLLILDYRPEDVAACVTIDGFTCDVHFSLLTGLSNGTSFDMVAQDTPWIWGADGDITTLLSGDVNGDGLADYLALTGKPGQSNLEAIEAGISLPAGGFALSAQAIPSGLAADTLNIVLGDVDGDGATDLLIATPVAPFQGAGCSPYTVTRPVLTRVTSNRDGTFAMPGRWDDCSVSREVLMPWSQLVSAAGGFRAADTNGDGLADFLLAFLVWDEPDQMHKVAIVDDISRPSGRDTPNWTATDVSGDGRLDFQRMLSSGSRSHILQIVQGVDGAFTSASTELPHFENASSASWRTGDFNGDGRADLVHIACRKADLLPGCVVQIDTFLRRADGSYQRLDEVRSTAAWLLGLPEANLASWRVADIDGDGKSSLVFLSSDRNGSGALFVHAFSLTDNWHDLGIAGPFSLGPAAPFATALDDVLTWQQGDIDGDGRTDLIHIIPNVDGNRVTVLRALGGNRWRFSDSAVPNPAGYAWYLYAGVRSPVKWHVLDVNGDGLADLVRTLASPEGMVIEALCSIGDGSWRSTASRPDVAQGVEVLRAAGRDDWMYAGRSSTAPPGLMRVDLAAGNALVVSALFADGSGTWSMHQERVADPARADMRARPIWSLADLRGDGRMRLLRLDADAPRGAIDVASLVSTSPGDLLRKVHSSGGAEVDIDYAPYSDFQPLGPKSGCTLPLGFFLTVVRTTAVWDGRSAGTRSRLHQEYGCPRWLADARTFSGWEEMVTGTPATANRDAGRVQQIYQHTESCGASLRAFGAIDAQKRPIVARTWIAPWPVAGEPWDCLPEQILQQTMETSADVPLVARLHISYDEFGNTTSLRRRGIVDDGGASSTTSLWYVPNTADWVVSAPSRVEIREDGAAGSSLFRLRRFCYDDDQTDTCGMTPTRGLVTRQIDLADPATPAGRTTIYAHDEAGNLTTIRNANGHTATMTYDPNYKVFPTLYTDALGRVAGTIYWDTVLARPWSIRNGSATPATIAYDALGRPAVLTLPSGGSMSRDYRDAGNPETQSLRDSWSDGSGADMWAAAYLDGLGRVYRLSRNGAGPFGHYERHVEYGDASDAPSQSSGWYCVSWWPFCTPRRPVTESFQYDAAGRLKRQRHGDATLVDWTQRVDGAESVSERSDEESVRSDILRDAFGRLAGVRGYVDGVAAQTHYRYDTADQITHAIDPLGNETEFIRNLAGETTTVRDPDLGTRIVERDNVGNIKTSRDAKGEMVMHTYDELERPKTTLLPNGRLLTFLYDQAGAGASLGRITSLLDTEASRCPENATHRWAYDAAGQLAGQTTCIDGVTKTVAFGHDLLGRLHAITYPDGEEIFYRYDAAGRVRSLSGIVNHISYDAADRPKRMHFANGMLSTYRYATDRNVLRAETAWIGGVKAFDAQYTYFRNLLLKSDASDADHTAFSYAYDGLARLSAVRGDATLDYQYDLAGNLAYRTGLGSLSYPGQGPLGCSPDGQIRQPCRLPHAVQTAGPFSMQYDANGAAFMVSRADGKSRALDWGVDHVPSDITDFDGQVAHYAYDGFGKRLSRSADGRVHRWFNSLVEQDDAGGLEKQYYIGGRRIATATSSGTLWTMSDRLDSVRGLTDASGNILEQARYQPFGNSGTNPAQGQFAGQQLEPRLQLIFMGPRLYDPSIGRFLSPDDIVPSLTTTQALNRYAYAYNNPLSFVDPGGHEPVGVYGAYQSGTSPDWFGGFMSPLMFSTGVYAATPSVDRGGNGVQPVLLTAPGVPPSREGRRWMDWTSLAEASALIVTGYSLGHMEALVPGAMAHEQQPVTFFFDLARAGGNLVGGVQGIGLGMELFGASGIGEGGSGGLATPLAVAGVGAGTMVVANSGSAIYAGATHLLNMAMSGTGKSSGRTAEAERKPSATERNPGLEQPPPFGCEEIADKIQAEIGGDKIEILHKDKGMQLGPFMDQSRGWYSHEVVVKDGRVFDASTRRIGGLPVEEYKALWRDRDDIIWLF